MGLLFKLKCFYIRTFKSIKYQEVFVTKTIFNSSDSLYTLKSLEASFKYLFKPSFYNYLFECAIYKKDLLSLEYIIEKTNLSIPQEKEILNKFQNTLLTNSLKSENYFAWLAIISSHTNLQLLGLEKNYNYEDHINFVSFIFNHNKVKNYLNSEQTKELVLKNCHENAKKMFEVLFLDIKLSNKKALHIVMPSKVKKI